MFKSASSEKTMLIKDKKRISGMDQNKKFRYILYLIDDDYDELIKKDIIEMVYKSLLEIFDGNNIGFAK